MTNVATIMTTNQATDSWIERALNPNIPALDTISPVMNRFAQEWLKHCTRSVSDAFTPALACAEHFDNWLSTKGVRETSKAEVVLASLAAIYTLTSKNGVIGFNGVAISTDGTTGK